MRRPGHSGRARGGFTIVEVVLAMGLLLLGMTSILGLLTFGATLARTAALRTAAASAAEAVVADLEETLFPLVPDPAGGEPRVGPPHTVEARPVPGHEGLVYSARPTPVPATDDGPDGPRRYSVAVEIAWKTGGRRRSRTFTTLLLREVPFGARLRREFLERDLDPLGTRLSASAPAAEEDRP